MDSKIETTSNIRAGAFINQAKGQPLDTIVANIDGQQRPTGGTPTDRMLRQAGTIIRRGGLVAFPTETVYGIGANGLDETAVKKIFVAKGRPSDNPLILHIADLSHLPQYVKQINDKARQLIDYFWPGPLTIIFDKSERIPYAVTGGLETVAVRMPQHPIAQWLIEYAAVPIVAPSANLSGKPSPTEVGHVIEDLQGKVDMILAGGNVEYGIESTVIDVTTAIPQILRPGSITRSMLEQVIGEVGYDPYLEDTSQKPKAPGMKYRHYAPKGHLQIISSPSSERLVEYIKRQAKQHQAQGRRVGLIMPNHLQDRFEDCVVAGIGDINNPKQIAKNLFAKLRYMDQQQVDIIFCYDFGEEEAMVAVMNRLLKAAAQNKISV